MFDELVKDLQEIKTAFLELRFGDAMRANIAFQQKLLEYYDMLVGDKPMTMSTSNEQLNAFEMKLNECEEEYELARGKVGISTLEILAVLKAGIDFGRMILDIWRNRNKPE